MQEVLDCVHMPVANRDGAVKFSSSIVILLRQFLDGFTNITFNSGPKLAIDMLHGTSADHEQQACPLYATSSAFGVVVPPAGILFTEVRGVDDVVVKVDHVKKALD
jgi:hypothetical protein